MNHLVPHLRSDLWSMPDDRARSLDVRTKAMADLVRAGLSPREKAVEGYNGGTTVVPEIDGDTATIEFIGDMVARAEWWAKAYLGVLDPLEVADAFDALAANAAIKLVVVEADSGGGTVAGAQEVADALARLRAAGKVVEVRVVGALCSAALWALCRADRIIATPTSVIGSIGVMALMVDVSAALAEVGVRYEVVRSGPDKCPGAEGTITDKLREQTKARIDGLAAIFFATLGAARGLSGAKLTAVTGGGFWLAAEAKTFGLIDVVGSVADEVEKPDGAAPPPEPVIAPIGDDDDTASAAATPPAADTTHQPAAAGASQESSMDANTKAALAALSQQHPTLAAALVAEAMKPEASAEKLHVFASAKAAEAATAQSEKLKADLATAQARADKAEADKAKAEADLAALKGHGTEHRDPGPGAAPNANTVSEKSQAELEAMSPHEKAKFFAAGGKLKVA